MAALGSRGLGWPVALVVAAVVAAGCGARWSDAEQRAVLARHDGGVRAPAGPGGPTPVATGAAAEAAVPTATSAPTAGPAATTPITGTPGAAACAAPSTAPGVTPKEIVIGNVSTLSGPVPGLGRSAQAAAQAYVAFRNATGGVCGRKLVLRTGDDGFDDGRFRSLMNQLGPGVLGFAGGLAAGDAGGAAVVESQQIPFVNTPTAEQMKQVSTVFDINPPFADVHAVIGKYRYLREQGVRTAALVYIAAPQTRHEVQTRHKPLMLAAGIQVVHEQELPLSTLSFDSAARAVANSGADYLLFVSESTQSAAMAQSMADTHYKLKFQEYVTAYASNFMDLAGPAAEGVVDWIGSLPNEEPGTTPEQANFLSWMARAAPDARPDVLAVGSWSGAKAFVDALAAIPGPISRAALVAQLRSMRSYDAGGLLGPIQLGPKRSNGCYIAMKVVNGTWKRLAPARGFLC